MAEGFLQSFDKNITVRSARADEGIRSILILVRDKIIELFGGNNN
jgi:hypothetical protein